jgi:hypothetical protein
MERENIVIKPKKLIMGVAYLGTVILVFGGAFNMYYFLQGKGDNISGWLTFLFTAIMAVGVLAGMLMALHISRFRIVLHKDTIIKEGLFKKELLISKVTDINVKSGMLKIKGTGMLQEISIGNLYTNYEEAKNFLEGIAAEHKHITFSES